MAAAEDYERHRDATHAARRLIGALKHNFGYSEYEAVQHAVAARAEEPGFEWTDVEEHIDWLLAEAARLDEMEHANSLRSLSAA
jgi:hypothetical protein